MSTLTNTLTPRQRARPSDFMLPPTDWRKNVNPGGRSGRFFSKAERFPTPPCRFQEFTTSAQHGSVAHAVKKLPNSAGATFRSKTPQRPEPKRPLTDIVTNPGGTFGGTRAKSPATSCFKSSADRFPFDDNRRHTPGLVRESARKDFDVLQYQGLPDWRKTPGKPNKPSASNCSKTDRFKVQEYKGPCAVYNPAAPKPPNPARAVFKSTAERFEKPKQLNEFYGNVPQVTPRGTSASVARSDRKVSAWSKCQGHEVFLPG